MKKSRTFKTRVIISSRRVAVPTYSTRAAPQSDKKSAGTGKKKRERLKRIVARRAADGDPEARELHDRIREEDAR